MTPTDPQPRRRRGTSTGGQYSPRKPTPPFEGLVPPSPDTIVRASAGEVEIAYEAAEGGQIQVRVRVLDPATRRWKTFGVVPTQTPAHSDPDRMSSTIASQALELAQAIAGSDDRSEAVDAFLAEVADRRDPLISRSERRRGGEGPRWRVWPGLDALKRTT